MHIRPAETDDMPVLVDLIQRAFKEVAQRFGLTKENCPTHPSLYTKERITADFNKGVAYFMLENEGAQMGCVALERAPDDICYLERLGVLPEKRRKGYGRALVERVITEARALDAKQISIGIIAHDQDLKSWYAHIGFVERKTREFKHLPFRVAFMAYEL